MGRLGRAMKSMRDGEDLEDREEQGMERRSKWSNDSWRYSKSRHT